MHAAQSHFAPLRTPTPPRAPTPGLLLGFGLGQFECAFSGILEYLESFNSIPMHPICRACGRPFGDAGVSMPLKDAVTDVVDYLPERK